MNTLSVPASNATVAASKPRTVPAMPPAPQTAQPRPAAQARGPVGSSRGRMPGVQPVPRGDPIGRTSTAAGPGSSSSEKPPDPILFQQWFKSVNPLRTYAAQIQRARNGNAYLVLTEGKRDKTTGEVKKIRLFLYGEDFESFAKLMETSLAWMRAHPPDAKFRAKRQKFWDRQSKDNGKPSNDPPRQAPSVARRTAR